MITSGTKRLIGVLGGMGPAATIDFLQKVVAATPATVDQDHVPLIVAQFPQIPSRTAALARGTDEPLQPMLSAVQLLERSGAEMIVIPCNTAHHWYDQLTASCRTEIVHIADAVRWWLAHRGFLAGRVALMGTRATLSSAVFPRRVPEWTYVLPSERVQVLVDSAIAAVKAGRAQEALEAASRAVDELLRDVRPDIVLLACTELPIALAGHAPATCVDATDALARLCVARSLRS